MSDKKESTQSQGRRAMYVPHRGGLLRPVTRSERSQVYLHVMEAVSIVDRKRTNHKLSSFSWGEQ